MEGVDTNAHVERLTTTHLRDVLVASDTGSLESLTAELFKLVRDEVDAERELTDGGTLTTEVERANLRVRNSTVVTALREGLVLAVAVAACGTTSHYTCVSGEKSNCLIWLWRSGGPGQTGTSGQVGA